MIVYVMKKEEIYSKLMGNSIPTYYKWLKQRRENNGINSNRLIIKLLNDYFTDDELEEFLTTHKIEKYRHYSNLLEIERHVLKPQAKKILMDKKDFNSSLDVLHLLKALKNRYETLIEEHIKEGKPQLDGKYDEIASHNIDEDGYLCEGYGYKDFNYYIYDTIFNDSSLISKLLKKEIIAHSLYSIQHLIVTIQEKHLEEVILQDYETLVNELEMKINIEKEHLKERQDQLAEMYYDESDDEDDEIIF